MKLRYAITKKDWSRFTRTTGNELYVRAFYQFDAATINSKATSPLTPLLQQHFIRAVHITLQIYEQTYHRNVRCVHVCRVETIHDEVVVRMPVVRLVCCRRSVMGGDCRGPFIIFVIHIVQHFLHTTTSTTDSVAKYLNIFCILVSVRKFVCMNTGATIM